ncbi:SDR family oxidoreductase [Streptomyces sp. NPDC050535]|uniref:SDR family oxidoreductase n=1 Tax=Streptomyces sp. NPDC050535 TaxID=3365626 RepID=UPI0037875E79
MILVTGATGVVGREVVRRLPSDLGVRVMVRDPGQAAEFAGSGVDVAVGDFGDAASLARAVDGVSAAFVVTVRIGADDDVRFVRAAQRAGVERVVKLSAAAVLDQGSVDLVTRWQRANEELLRVSGVEWTLLRPRAFMSNALGWASSVRGEGVVRALYGESACACVDPRDVAEVAARVLAQPGHAGRAYTLTGPEALTAADQARQLGQLLKAPLRFEELTRGAARAGWLRRYPAAVAEALLESAERQRAGVKTQVEDTVRVVTGRPPGSFREWARDHLEAFAPVRQEPGSVPAGS